MQINFLKKEIPVEVSARHAHLSKNDLDRLFGKNYKLKKLKNLFQKGEFAAKETLELKSDFGRILRCRIIGPVRKESQIEISKTDAIFLRIKAPLRESGNLKNTPGMILSGPKGEVKLKQGVINNWRHIHCNFDQAKKLGLEEDKTVSVKVGGICATTFHNVKIKLGEKHQACLHLDTDEGNAANLREKGRGKIL